MINVKEVKEHKLPAIAVRGLVILPNNEVRLEIGREQSVKALVEAEHYENHVVLINQKDPIKEEPKTRELLDFGIVAKIIMKIKLPNGNYKVKFKTLVRSSISEYIEETPYLLTNVKTLPGISENDQKEIALIRMIVNDIIESADLLFTNSKEVINLIQGTTTADKISDIIAYNLRLPENEKMKYVELVDVNDRLQKLLVDIEKTKEIAKIEEKISTEVKRNINENQREYYLREKMKAIQDELGEKTSRESEASILRDKVEEAKMPEDTKKKALDELRRFESLPQHSSESGVIRNYLEWLINIPWYKKSKEKKDLNYAEEILDADHYGLEKVKERIVEYLAVKQMTGKTPPTILCLVGPPGVGKTSLAKSVAKSLNRNFVKVSLGGVKDESEVRGHRRTYLGAMPGRIIQAMKTAGTINPVFLLDEIDKMSSDYKGDPSSAMLEVLDPEQNKMFSDHYLEENYDLSHVLFISTANYLGNIPEPLKDRMEIVQVSSYTEHEKFEIAKRHLIPKQLEQHGLTTDQITIKEDALKKIIGSYTREAGVRSLERNIGSLCRKATKKILTEKVDSIEFTADNVIDYLGKPIFFHNKADETSQVGVVNGLAYTPYGGDTLPVEVTTFKGSGKLVLTGKLGDVMKESAQAALSFVKANAEKYDVKPDIFKEVDVHIHVPEGATPKDGPSAGITMATAIVSALSNTKVDHLIGMTGEITLRGRVLPIGGLKEKSIAAHRSGLKTVIMPKQNEKDLDDIPDIVKNDVKFIPVTCINEVFEEALIK
ncbi:endopeptidase La [Haloplasma contractile]|uniref:Lon protease n=1 Tax=Haloplasma contractile SSD-17B TaxID=1033810 RepID=U2EG19_9MOLU|nr:endopeptidase La [Haloplasma contractile]ERJ13561.1 Lon protease 1 protein [Haloplasma contractile SSD-17B]